ncbi:peptide chain release factor 2 (bRF-2) [Serpentinicella alkaliphila]|uniref:Peptide chain release factor 2 n=2 Tax=Serpentinicella alkaliphila TaxID=1734049 RepID=A0A4R2TEA0_9FIRM|nr:peptide chain release factor 2 (bRF-2) [Serpentinicella alkaliphila]
MSEETFWNDPEKAQDVVKTTKAHKDKIEEFNSLVKMHEDIEMMISFIEEGDSSFEAEMKETLAKIEDNLDILKLETLLSGEYDSNNAILSIHAGTGGLDAQDWAKMLLRMYLRWAEKKGYKVKTLDLIDDPEAGIKSATLLIEGINAYGYLKSEKGVHRLVRISPFNASGKRHTSFASIDVMPEIDDSVQIDINPAHLRIDTFRSSGAGGQHINTTDSAVRITHIPTGVVVACQNERSQHSNKDTAMKMLKAKLLELKRLEQKERIEDIQGEYGQIAWGNQIRSYVFNPYNLVKDHRTNAETGNLQVVMDGEIDLFINAYLKSNINI